MAHVEKPKPEIEDMFPDVKCFWPKEIIFHLYSTYTAPHSQIE